MLMCRRKLALMLEYLTRTWEVPSVGTKLKHRDWQGTRGLIGAIDNAMNETRQFKMLVGGLIRMQQHDELTCVLHAKKHSVMWLKLKPSQNKRGTDGGTRRGVESREMNELMISVVGSTICDGLKSEQLHKQRKRGVALTESLVRDSIELEERWEPFTPPPFTSFPTASPTRIAPFVVPTTDFGTGTVRPPPHVTPPSDLTSLFTSTVISPRTRPKPYTRHSATVPWETGIPNILVHSSSTTTVQPLPSFELLIVGSKTRPFFDRRLGRITEQTDDLLCDFTHTFPCLWGAESGRWAIVHKGAIPSLDQELDSSEEESPQYPSIVVIQGTAMLSSDPLRCQSGSGKADRLIEQATLNDNLCQCYVGWCPFW